MRICPVWIVMKSRASRALVIDVMEPSPEASSWNPTLGPAVARVASRVVLRPVRERSAASARAAASTMKPGPRERRRMLDNLLPLLKVSVHVEYELHSSGALVAEHSQVSRHPQHRHGAVGARLPGPIVDR